MGRVGKRREGERVESGTCGKGVEGRQALQYSWLALYVSHKLAGELPLSDSLTEHTLFPARIVSSLHLFPSRSFSLPLLSCFCSHPLSPALLSSLLSCYPPSSFPKIKVYKLTRACICVSGTRVWIRCSQRRLRKQKRR